MSRRGIGSLSILLGLALLLGALALVLHNLNEANNAARISADTMEKLGELLPPTLIRADVSRPAAEPAPLVEVPRKEPLKRLRVDGEEYVGVISVPALELELPVLSEWNYEHLQKATCRYYGEDPAADLVICAHNYPAHFGRFRQELLIGETVLFTDMNGVVYTYVVDAKEELAPTAVPDVKSGEWPLTLFTCTPGGRTRVVVRCDLAEP